MKQVVEEMILKIAIASKVAQTIGLSMISIALLWDIIKYGTQSFFEYNIGWLGRAVGVAGIILIIVAKQAKKAML